MNLIAVYWERHREREVKTYLYIIKKSIMWIKIYEWVVNSLMKKSIKLIPKIWFINQKISFSYAAAKQNQSVVFVKYATAAAAQKQH